MVHLIQSFNAKSKNQLRGLASNKQSSQRKKNYNKLRVLIDLEETDQLIEYIYTHPVKDIRNDLDVSRAE